MQRLYSVFPRGSPGYGLLLLRLIQSAYLVSHGVWLVVGLDNAVRSVTPALLGGWWVLSGLLIGAGLLAPLVQTAVAAAQAIVWAFQLWMPGAPLGAMGTGWAVQLSMVIAASLALLGPGAYSVDAYLFGRKEINIPANHDTRLTRDAGGVPHDADPAK